MQAALSGGGDTGGDRSHTKDKWNEKLRILTRRIAEAERAAAVEKAEADKRERKLRADNSALKNKLRQSQQAYASRVEELKAVVLKHSNASLQLPEAQRKAAEATERIVGLEASLKARTAECALLRQRETELMAKLHERAMLVDLAQDEVHKLERRMQETARSSAAALRREDESTSALLERVEETEQRLQEEQNQRRDLEGALASCRAQIEHVEAERETLRERQGGEAGTAQGLGGWGEDMWALAKSWDGRGEGHADRISADGRSVFAQLRMERERRERAETEAERVRVEAEQQICNLRGLIATLRTQVANDKLGVAIMRSSDQKLREKVGAASGRLKAEQDRSQRLLMGVEEATVGVEEVQDTLGIALALAQTRRHYWARLKERGAMPGT